MAPITKESKEALISSFLDALNRHDVDAMMSHMSEVWLFETSGGPEVYGFRYRGSEGVRKGYLSLWERLPDAHCEVTSVFVYGERAFSEWTVSATQRDESSFTANGVDLFNCDEDKFAVVISYRKFRTPT